MPDFRRVDAMPARDLARAQQIINGRRTSASVRAGVIAKGLAVEAALGMRLQVERRDDLVCRHGIAPSGRKELGPPLRTRNVYFDASTLLGAALLRFLEAVEEPGGVRAGKRLQPVRLPLLNVVSRDGSLRAQELRFAL